MKMDSDHLKHKETPDRQEPPLEIKTFNIRLLGDHIKPLGFHGYQSMGDLSFPEQKQRRKSGMGAEGGGGGARRRGGRGNCSWDVK